MKLPFGKHPPLHVLVVDRDQYTVKLMRRDNPEAEFRVERRYHVAVGMKGHRTPRGVYAVNSKAKCPEWLVPNEDWAIAAGLTPGTVVPGCTEENPLKARWIGFTSDHEVGFHGTAAVDTLGTPASHGCIRMAARDVIDLYDRVERGTTVVVH